VGARAALAVRYAATIHIAVIDDARSGADDLVAWLRTRGAKPAAELPRADPPA
jgi:hypothetical protein